ncbi:molybdate ABC transporter substrate-binding protein [Oricola sp.]|uniref:molybdate ABC transporter substrate-binding protein n=1 Tax=Oricola sp. TaxID=1979950 RepID=UPI0025E9DCB6|nr:molybdate ABC transporter substrate-binding protein [Oricola sp.]MCI5074740.1 molybdate ABC transporter substrate-binding protein [Oricola sp.]
MTHSTAIFRTAICAAGLAALVLGRPSAAAAQVECGDTPLIVFAAASMTDAVGEIATAFAEQTGCETSVSFAGSSTLARQIAQGAPAGVFLSANRDWVSWLTENAPEQVAGTAVTVARNGLVAVSRSGETGDIAELLSARFAMGDPEHVPAGIYAKSALETLGIWQDVSPNAAFTENVRVALALAARGEVGAAIVYSTDARMEPDLAVAYRFDPASHPEIAYEAVLLKRGGPAGAAFLDMLSGPQGRRILSTYGFLPGSDGGSG